MASSDSLVIYIKSSGNFNFSMPASPNDDIATLKKKAEAQHLALFPQNGKIVAQAIKMWAGGTCYYLSDDFPVRCVWIGGHGIPILYMDAVTAPPDSTETETPTHQLQE